MKAAATLRERFCQELRLRGRGECTLRSYPIQIGVFQNWCGQDLHAVGQEELKAYLAHLRGRKLKTASISAAFTALNSFYDFLEAEGEIERNPIPVFRRRYLQQYKAGTDRDERRCISVEEAARLVVTALDSRRQAVLLLLMKTGMRVHELSALDVGDIDMMKKEILLKPTPKRSNRTLFFDEEAARTLGRWLSVRASQGHGPEGALFPAAQYARLYARGIEEIVIQCSRAAGVGDPGLKKDYITPHYFRVFFTTQLLRAGMPRHYVQELRGDSDGAAIDIYTRIDHEDLRRGYLAHIPQLGI